MNKRSKLLSIKLRNIGCIGGTLLDVPLDNIVCLVGRNNAGKSTVLRAYELAVGTVNFDPSRDRCQKSTADSISEIILDVHIPEGVGNIGEKWIDSTSKSGLRIVRSRWFWQAPSFNKVRQTWDPSLQLWSDDGKAGGADAVFTSRLPKPLRIESLTDAATLETKLLTLILDPALSTLKTQNKQSDTSFAETLKALAAQVEQQAESHRERFDNIAKNISTSFEKVFPGLKVSMNVKMALPSIKMDELLSSGSSLRIKDGDLDTTLSQQGTGARRALFWAMLQVRSALEQEQQIGKSKAKAKTKGKKSKQDIINDEADINGNDDLDEDEISSDNVALPGHILLMDEPENALHPMAIRAAQRHLYALAQDPEWQVMLTTHSPYFINPLADHTTIIRLEREGDGSHATPRTYKAEEVGFTGDEKARLQALQKMDSGLAEVFFGSYPVIVEGETEHAAFLTAILEEGEETGDVLTDDIAIINARGKALIVPLMKIMRHFKISSFGIMHDADQPFQVSTKPKLKEKYVKDNGMWTENKKIFEEILLCRKEGIVVRHRVSLPDFERFIGCDERDSGKPENAYVLISRNNDLKTLVRQQFLDLKQGDASCPILEFSKQEADSMLSDLKTAVVTWAITNGVSNDPRYSGLLINETVSA